MNKDSTADEGQGQSKCTREDPGGVEGPSVLEPVLIHVSTEDAALIRGARSNLRPYRVNYVDHSFFTDFSHVNIWRSNSARAVSHQLFLSSAAVMRAAGIIWSSRKSLMLFLTKDMGLSSAELLLLSSRYKLLQSADYCFASIT